MVYMCIWCWQNLVHLMFFSQCQWPNMARVMAQYGQSDRPYVGGSFMLKTISYGSSGSKHNWESMCCNMLAGLAKLS